MDNKPSIDTLRRLSRHAVTMDDAVELAKAGRVQIKQLADAERNTKALWDAVRKYRREVEGWAAYCEKYGLAK